MVKNTVHLNKSQQPPKNKTHTQLKENTWLIQKSALQCSWIWLGIFVINVCRMCIVSFWHVFHILSFKYYMSVEIFILHFCCVAAIEVFKKVLAVTTEIKTFTFALKSYKIWPYWTKVSWNFTHGHCRLIDYC